jgi:hypothetical protein
MPLSLRHTTSCPRSLTEITVRRWKSPRSRWPCLSVSITPTCSSFTFSSRLTALCPVRSCRSRWHRHHSPEHHRCRGTPPRRLSSATPSVRDLVGERPPHLSCPAHFPSPPHAHAVGSAPPEPPCRRRESRRPGRAQRGDRCLVRSRCMRGPLRSASPMGWTTQAGCGTMADSAHG